MDECVGDMTPPSPTNAGTVILRSGKWVAKIRHPIRKVWVCLGIYNNHEEASDAYTRKKLEYESHSVQETDASFNTNVADLEKRTGVKRTTSGKWGANIIHKKVSVWLGSYNTLNEAADAYEMSKLELQSPKVGSLTKANGSVGSGSRLENDYSTAEDSQEVLNQKKCELGLKDEKAKKICLGSFDTAEEAEDTYNNTMCHHKKPKDSCKADAIAADKSDAPDNDNCKLDSGFGSSSLKDGITQAVSSPFASAHKREVCRRGSVYQVKSGKWKAEIQIRKVKHKLGIFATVEDAQEALNRKKCELGLKTQDAQEAVNRKKCELGMNGDAEQSERNQRRRHAYLRKSGRWHTEIRHPMKKAKRIYLGAFDTAEEAEDAYKSTRRQFELMFPGYMNESVQLGTLTEEAEEAYNNKMREVDLIVSAHKKPKQSKVNLIAEGTSDDPFVCTSGSSVIKADREEDADAGGSIINVNVESVPRFVKEETGEFDLGVIDSCGQLVGEYSTMDDDLWIG